MRVHYKTFGCKANQYDTERMRQEVEGLGGITADTLESAEVCVVNTCTVTNQADADARRYIAKVGRERPGTQVVVAGCSAALRASEYRSQIGVVAVIEGHDPETVADAVAKGGLALDGAGPLVQLTTKAGPSRLDHEPIGGALLRQRLGRTRGWLKVQDGCDRKCAFCATRLARGTSRSRPVEEVVREALLLSDAHPELVITGIHIGHYGRDLDPPTSLSSLVAELLTQVPGVRFRLGSIEATEVDDALVDLLADEGASLVPHLHMPLQSGADPVLRAMRRWHTREMYRSRALEIAARVPCIGLGADIITGFPGETEADHESTLALVAELPFTYLHVFPFSPRDGTVAAGLPDPVPQRTAGERSSVLRALGIEKGRAYRRRRVGETAEVVVEGDGRSGVTEDYLRVGVDWNGPRSRETAVISATLQGDPDGLYIQPT